MVGNDWTVYEGTSIGSPAAYAAIKGGVVNFTRYLAALYGKDGIRINSVSPGGIINNQPEPFVRAYERKYRCKDWDNRMILRLPCHFCFQMKLNT